MLALTVVISSEACNLLDFQVFDSGPVSEKHKCEAAKDTGLTKLDS